MTGPGSPPVLHATLVALWKGGRWNGVLLRGPSGAGKSALALRCLEGGWGLVADDRALVWSSGGRLYGRAHPNLEGLVEARGLGILPVPHLDWVEIRLTADLVHEEGAVERMPEPASVDVAGIVLPLVALWAHDAAAPAKLALALACAATPLGLPLGQAYQAPRTNTAGQGPDVTRGPLKRNR
jgi:serine kinase of HPr protein (carbohydrate metabolism regulator)